MNHPAVEINYSPSEEIKVRYEALKNQQPEIRARNAAEELGVTEGELLACQVGENVKRLVDNPQDILKSLDNLGELMALTRNENCVHERKGEYLNAQFFEHGKMKQGLFANPDIDLRLFMNHWKYCFAVNENNRNSIQFFDKSGTAIHKIYLTNNSNIEEYKKVVENFTAQEQNDYIEIEQYDQNQTVLDDSEIDWKAFRQGWENLKDTHDFYPMLRKFKVERQQAFRNIGSDFAYKVDNSSTRKILELARDKECEIMVFVGNRGCLQIHTGPVKKLVEHGPWYNVLDPKFNLHLREDKIETSWITRKPTEDGIVTALEIFDANGDIIATFFGKRKPGIPELELWREITSLIEALEQ